MATCKDCLHFEVCDISCMTLGNASRTHLMPCDDCPCFKDRTRFVEVVRCRDCKYSYGNKYCTNDAWKDEGNTVYIDADEFCSYGERRNDNADN